MNAQESLLAEAADGGWTYCGYSKEVKAAASKLEVAGLGRISENDCGPIFLINDAGRSTPE